MTQKKKPNAVAMDDYQSAMIGDKLNFATAEAYRLLRANLMFSLPDQQGCCVIGVTSSVRGEGKSTTSINLAYTLAEANLRVLLIEADMRMPVQSKRLNVNKTPGLSNLLAGQASERDALQKAKLHSNLTLITAGDIPPNPSELLASEQMKKVLKNLEAQFDYIILDLPPVTAVSDAVVISGLTQGMVVVVRQDYTNKRALNDTIRQLQFVDTKILGFVMTCAGTQRGTYSKYKRYKKYGKYGYGSHYGYGQKSRAAKDSQ